MMIGLTCSEIEKLELQYAIGGGSTAAVALYPAPLTAVLTIGQVFSYTSTALVSCYSASIWLT